MKKFVTLLFVSVVSLFVVGCASSSSNMEDSKKVQPNNIDKNNVGITASEAPDQTDPTLIEGNLEKNDFKN